MNASTQTPVFFAHSGGPQARPGEGSYDLVDWLRAELGPDYQVSFPLIDKPEAPSYAMWEAMFERELKPLGENLVLVGHSLGASMLLKYLSEHSTGLNIKGLMLVAAPFWNPENPQLAEFALAADFQRHLPAVPAIHLFHGLQDPEVPFAHALRYQERLPGAVLHQLNQNDHVFADGLPELAAEIKALD